MIALTSAICNVVTARYESLSKKACFCCRVVCDLSLVLVQTRIHTVCTISFDKALRWLSECETDVAFAHTRH